MYFYYEYNYIKINMKIYIQAIYKYLKLFQKKR